MKHSPFQNEAVASRFASYPPAVPRKLLTLRELVLATAKSHPEVGELEETLKWGEPAYVTPGGAGSTVRMDWKARAPHQSAMHFNCQTSLVESFRTMCPNDFRCEGNRALVFGLDDAVPFDALSVCVAASLTCHPAHSRSPSSPRSGASRSTPAARPRAGRRAGGQRA